MAETPGVCKGGRENTERPGKSAAEERESKARRIERRFGNQLRVQGPVTESGKTTVLSRETHARARRNEV